MAAEASDKLPSGDVKCPEINMPLTFQQEWTKLHSLFPESKFTIQNSQSEQVHVFVPLSFKHENYELIFSLTSDYPFEVPDIFLQASLMSKSEVNEILKNLDLICAGSMGHPMLLPCIEEAKKLFQMHFCDDQNFLKKKLKKKRANVNSKCKFSNEKIKSLVSDENFSLGDTSSNLEGIETQGGDSATNLVSAGASLVNETKSLSLRPNFFIALRIMDESLIQNLTSIQDILVEQETLLTKGVIPSSALHITLCNLGLDNADDLVKAIEALRKMKPELQSALPTSPLIIHGASQFYDRAIYAKVKVNDKFLAFRDILIRNLEAANVDLREDHENYTPHVTLIKVRRPERRMFGNRPLRPALYSSFLDCVHGEQLVDAVYLCSMDGNKRDDGFYVTPCELQFKPAAP